MCNLARAAVNSLAAKLLARTDLDQRREVQQWTRWKEQGGGLAGEFPERQILNMGGPFHRLIFKKDPAPPEVETLVAAIRTARGIEEVQATNIAFRLLQEILGELPEDRAELDQLATVACERFGAEIIEPVDVLIARSVAPLNKVHFEMDQLDLADGMVVRRCEDAELRRFQGVGYGVVNRVFAGDEIAHYSTCYATHTVRARRAPGVTFPPAGFMHAFEILSLSLKLLDSTGSYIGNVRTLTPYTDPVAGVSTSPPPFPGDGPLGHGQEGPFLRLTPVSAPRLVDQHARVLKACPKEIPVYLRWFAKGCHEHENADRFLDLMISLESLVLGDLGAKDRGELRFRLSLRVAWLLGRDAASRSALRKQAGAFYDTRSQLVHGGNPPQPQELKQQSDDLETFVRTTINKFMTLADAGKRVDWDSLVMG